MKPAFNVRQQSEIFIGPLADILSGVLPEGRVVVVSDSTIDRLYHSVLAQYDTVLIGLGESVKTMQTVEMIYRRFIELGVDRSTFVLAVGGGIVTDVAGFAASTYMRGVKFGFVSTTLLGQVDASVGGKNGVNVDGYKNMAGTFTQPQFVICDPALLRTLPEREFRAGLAEVVKAAIIADADLFGRIERTTFEALRTDTDLLSDAVSAAIRVKADIVERDERESGDRPKLHPGAACHREGLQPHEPRRGRGGGNGADRRGGGEAGCADAGRLRPDRECADGAGLRPDAARGGETPAERGRQGQEKRRRHAADRPAGRDRRLRGAADDDGCLRGVVLELVPALSVQRGSGVR